MMGRLKYYVTVELASCILVIGLHSRVELVQHQFLLHYKRFGSVYCAWHSTITHQSRCDVGTFSRSSWTWWVTGQYILAPWFSLSVSSKLNLKIHLFKNYSIDTLFWFVFCTLIPRLKAHAPISDTSAPTLWIRRIRMISDRYHYFYLY